MVRCCIFGCTSRATGKINNITFHRLPKKEEEKKKWLEIIGVNNINISKNRVLVCSLHFNDSSFNRTYNLSKLRDGALPSPDLIVTNRPNISGNGVESDEKDPLSLPSISREGHIEETGHNPTNKIEQGTPSPSRLCSSTSTSREIVTNRPNISGIGVGSDENDPLSLPPMSRGGLIEETKYDPTKKIEQGTRPNIRLCPSTSTSLELVHAHHTVNRLQEKCKRQRLKIKQLQEKVRRQRKKIDALDAFKKYLKVKNLQQSDTVLLVEDCDDPQDPLKMQITKCRLLPLQREGNII